MDLTYLRFKVRPLFESEQSLFSSAPILALVSFVPSWLVTYTASKVLEGLGHSPKSLLPSFEVHGLMFLVVIVLGPLFETFLLAGGLWVIGRLIRNPWAASIVSGLVWAGVHGYQSPLWALGTVWPFIVFSRAYLAWRARSLSDAIGIAWLTHSCHNAMAIGVSYLGA